MSFRTVTSCRTVSAFDQLISDIISENRFSERYMMRLFFAVPVSQEVRNTVAGTIRRSLVSDAPWRWIHPDNYHITLKFLGDTARELVKPLEQAAARAAGRARPFNMFFDSFGGFPELRKPRVLFYDIAGGAAELSTLAGLIDSEVELLGFEKEKRPFRAHLTLARVRKQIDASMGKRLETVSSLPENTSQEVTRFVLMRSHLARSGATYEEIAEFFLG